MKILFDAITACDLKQQLEKACISVPKRSKWRTKDDVEKYDMSYLLNCLLRTGLLTFPVKLIHRDRPDFLLVMGDRNIGIEHTEAVSQNEIRKEIMRETDKDSRTRFIPPVLYGEKRKNRQELLKEASENLQGDGWEGDLPEIVWAEVVLHSVRHKLGITRKSGYERFGENWLLIYNNWSFPAPNIRKVALAFSQRVKNTGALEEFDRVFISKDNLICDVSPDGIALRNVGEL